MKCEACERGDHVNCGMQTWCECECAGPDSIDFEPPDCCPDCGSVGHCALGCPSRLP